MPQPPRFLRFTDRFSAWFTSSVRLKGLQYSSTGRVRIEEGNSELVEARVRGTTLYEVTLTVLDNEISATCECPYSGFCKHIWATLLQAEKLGYLSDARNAAILVRDYEDNLEPEDEGEFDLRPPQPAQRPEPPSRWRGQLHGLRTWDAAPQRKSDWPSGRELLYAFDVPEQGVSLPSLHVSILTRDPRKNGPGWNKTKELKIARAEIADVANEADRAVLALLAGSRPVQSYSYYMSEPLPSTFELHAPLTETILPMLFATGRVFYRTNRYAEAELHRLTLDEGAPWRFELSIVEDAARGYLVDGQLMREGDTPRPLRLVQMATNDGALLMENRLGRLANREALRWLRHLRGTGPIFAPEREGDELLSFVLSENNGFPVHVPESLSYQRVDGTPRPWLAIRERSSKSGRSDKEKLWATLQFRYGDWMVSGGAPTPIYDKDKRVFIVRDAAAERLAEEHIENMGVRYDKGLQQHWLLRTRVAPVVTKLLLDGWLVDVDGKAFRQSTGSRMEVTTGIDWFDLSGEVTYGDTSADMPALLEALRRGESVVQLSDGSYGLVPEEWMARFGRLAQMGDVGEQAVRFSRAQTGLLDALLAADETIRFDEGFTHARQQLQRFDGIGAAEQPATFEGTLRDYQREGLGWLEFLGSMRWGGCLADDMGLGKTAQVLAMLEKRRVLRTAEGVSDEDRPVGPSLVVVPKSLVFNWKAEAARFTPSLRVFEYTGTGRRRDAVMDYDVVLTTYGTLRRDVTMLRELEFDYVVLDEAQAIKNASTDSAKAVRLLKGRHRLAMSGTPIENHLGELWSLFEFLNPGMLGSATAFGAAGSGRRDLDEEGRRLLARALRPFILRRTKQQVASELPDRTEQTLWCELSTAERKLYDELRAHYRASLLGRIDQVGLSRSKMHVLEALLRLRQASCHPGLLDPKRAAGPSSKVDLLIEQLQELMEEGHKALVFSQFTSLLAIVRQRLDALGIVYEYLDGSTNDRQAPVERFQNDPSCKLFLISLKAGGLGLNLTAAEYVFLLDPWWNPAVEAQAIDRAHRIGQTRAVFAYRLIARDTVEEKVLELQKSKRELAAAIIAEDNSLVRDLKREDLELLLS